MLKRVLTWLVWLPLALVVIALGVANRHSVALGWNPFEPLAPADAIQLPVFAVLLIVFAGGAVVGGFIVWNTQRRFRRRAREEHRRAEKLDGEVERMKASVPAAGNALAAPR
jgi:membrane protein implicated in regulation of membrane protease activity